MNSDNYYYLIGNGGMNALLMKHITTNPWPKSKHLVDLIVAMRRFGMNTLILVGDSMSRQMLDGSSIELKRAGIETEICSFEFKGSGLENKRADCMDILPHWIIDSKKEEKPYFRIVLIPDLFDYEKKSFIPDEIGNLKYLKAYLETGLVVGKTVIIFNTGLHFQRASGYNEKTFGQLIDKLVKVMLEFANDGHIVMYRENSSQHFPSETGSFEWEVLKIYDRPYGKAITPISWVSLIGSKSGLIPDDLDKYTNETKYIIFEPNNNPIKDYYGCVPIKNESMLVKQNWQSMIVEDKLKSYVDSGLIGMLYFFNITAARHDLHKGVSFFLIYY